MVRYKLNSRLEESEDGSVTYVWNEDDFVVSEAVREFCRDSNMGYSEKLVSPHKN